MSAKHLVLVSNVSTAAASIGNASASLCCAVVLALIGGVDIESIVQAIKDGAASVDVSGNSLSVYVSQARRVARVDKATLTLMASEAKKAGVWPSMASAIKAYEIPAVQSTKRGPAKVAEKAQAETDGQTDGDPAPTGALPTGAAEMLQTLRSLRASLPTLKAAPEVLDSADAFIAAFKVSFKL